MVNVMGKFYEKVSVLREYRSAATAALEEIDRGGIVTQNGTDVTKQRRQFYQNVLAKIDALIAAYGGIDAPRP
jgi:hypothetical protein